MNDSTRPLVDLEILEQLRLIAEDDPDFVPGLIQILEEDTIQFIGATTARQPDFPTLRRKVHKLLGACSNLGAVEAARLLVAIQDAAHTQDAAALPDLLNNFAEVMPPTLLEMRRVFGA